MSKTKTNSNNGMPMFKTADDIKSFLLWAKQQGIQKVKVGEVEVEFNSLHMIPEDSEIFRELTNTGASTLAEANPDQKNEDDEDLYFSS